MIAVTWIATRFGESIGLGASPEEAAEDARRRGFRRCDVEPSLAGLVRPEHIRPWRTEADFLRHALMQALQGCDSHGNSRNDWTDEQLLQLIDDIERELLALDGPLEPSLPLPLVRVGAP